MGLKFGLIGDGKIAAKHKHAVDMLGGEITEIYDPKYKNKKSRLSDKFFKNKDWIVICSPNHLHSKHIKMALAHNKKIIVEKPMVLPWEPVIDDDRINVVLQYRCADLPGFADRVRVVMARDKKYFEGWAGNAQMTGGLFYHLFIHYIDLAIRLKAKFVGTIISKGVQIRRVDDIDLFRFDMNDLYMKMYNDIIIHEKGVKPSELFYLYWVLERCGWKYGINSEDLVDKNVNVDCRNGIDI